MSVFKKTRISTQIDSMERSTRYLASRRRAFSESEKKIRKIEIPEIFVKAAAVKKNTTQEVFQSQRREMRRSRSDIKQDNMEENGGEPAVPRTLTSDSIARVAPPLGDGVDEVDTSRKPKEMATKRMSSTIRRIQDKIKKEQMKDMAGRDCKDRQQQQPPHHIAAMNAVTFVKNARRQRSKSRTKQGKIKFNHLQRPYRRWLGVSTCVASDTRFIVGPNKTDEVPTVADKCKNNNETSDGLQHCPVDVHNSPQASLNEEDEIEMSEIKLYIGNIGDSNVVSNTSTEYQLHTNDNSPKLVRKINRNKQSKKRLRFLDSEPVHNREKKHSNDVGENLSIESNESTIATKTIALEPFETTNEECDIHTENALLPNEEDTYYTEVDSLFTNSENHPSGPLPAELSHIHVTSNDSIYVDPTANDKSTYQYEKEYKEDIVTSQIIYSNDEIDPSNFECSLQPQEEGNEKDPIKTTQQDIPDDPLAPPALELSSTPDEDGIDEDTMTPNQFATDQQCSPSIDKSPTQPEEDKTKIDCIIPYQESEENDQEKIDSPPQLENTGTNMDSLITSEFVLQPETEQINQTQEPTNCEMNFPNVENSFQFEEDNNILKEGEVSEKDMDMFVSHVDTADRRHGHDHPQMPGPSLLLPKMGQAEHEPTAPTNAPLVSGVSAHLNVATASKATISSLHTFSDQGGLAGCSVNKPKYEFMDSPPPDMEPYTIIRRDPLAIPRPPAKTSLREEMRTFRDRQLFEIKAHSTSRTSTFKWLARKIRRARSSKEYINVLAIKDTEGTLPGQLSFRKGQTIKQLDTGLRDVDGMFYGYYRVGRLRTKTWGIYPCSHISVFFDDEDDNDDDNCDDDRHDDGGTKIDDALKISKPKDCCN